MAHFPTVRHGFERYIATDHDPKVVEWLKSGSWDPRVEIRQVSGASLAFENNSIDRIIATHVLEHVSDPVGALEEWVRVLKPGGVLSLILPSDPGMAWRLGRAFGPRAKTSASGLPYDYYMSVEHVNGIFNLRHILKHHFPNRVERWWPFRVPVPDINLIYATNLYVQIASRELVICYLPCGNSQLPDVAIRFTSSLSSTSRLATRDGITQRFDLHRIKCHSTNQAEPTASHALTFKPGLPMGAFYPGTTVDD